MSVVVIAETWRRNVVSIGFVIYTLLCGLVAAGSGSLTGSASAMSTWMVVLALVLGCRIIGPEFSSGTLQLILAKPITRSAYLLSRVAGTALSVWTAIAFVALFNLIGRQLGHHPLNLAKLFATMLNLSLDTLLVIALLALFGSATRSYFNIAIYLAIEAGLAVALAIYGIVRNARPDIAKMFSFMVPAVDFLQNNLFADAPIDHFDRGFVLLALSNAAIALVVACFLFRRREVPYGAD